MGPDSSYLFGDENRPDKSLVFLALPGPACACRNRQRVGWMGVKLCQRPRTLLPTRICRAAHSVGRKWRLHPFLSQEASGCAGLPRVWAKEDRAGAPLPVHAATCAFGQRGAGWPGFILHIGSVFHIIALLASLQITDTNVMATQGSMTDRRGCKRAYRNSGGGGRPSRRKVITTNDFGFGLSVHRLIKPKETQKGLQKARKRQHRTNDPF